MSFVACCRRVGGSLASWRVPIAPRPPSLSISYGAIRVMSGLLDYTMGVLMNRRHFLMGTAASVPMPGRGRSSPNDTIRVACIGVGNPDLGVKGQGRVHPQRYSEMHNVEVAAIRDVDQRLIAHGQELVEKLGRKKPAGFTDIRKALED